MRTTTKLITALALATLVAGTESAAARSQAGDGVLLVDVYYVKGEWTAKEPRILPCAGQSKASRNVPDPAAIRTLGPKGEVLYERRLLNPRIVLVESPKSLAPMLDELDFTLKAPYREGTAAVEFWESLKAPKPSLRVDLAGAVKAFEAAGGFDQEADCRPPKIRKTPAAKAPPVKEPEDNQVALMALRDLLRKDPETVFAAAMAAGVEPEAVAEFLEAVDPAELERLKISRDEAAKHLAAYERYWKAKRKG